MNKIPITMHPIDIKVSQIVDKLVQHNVLYSDTHFQSEKFHHFKKGLVGNIQVPSTTISPIMERMLFAIPSSSNVQNIVILGSYFGYAVFWLAGGMNHFNKGKVVGFDINKEACEGARNNLKNIDLDWVEIKSADAFTGIKEFEDSSIDLIFIDVEKNGSKSDYALLLDTWYSKLKPGALVLAHDPVIEKFSEDFKKYYERIEDKQRFSVSVTLPIDQCGLCISRTIY
ncbi:MAG TPA: class I SAM-dependent methyltransferase [Bacillus sp. (in: firmicutes)]|uniref:O-methyltransferase n=1 Tax=Bacillus litorisediminis TaxID=2922713 RepID=UPI001FADB42F|nr:class I SAM-dependent methyltransferase [Bacillus litorisediminis]HWO75952.1 class I SAM-dependent methyltransferase [Bacillus sp. (in: firmicutes)]